MNTMQQAAYRVGQRNRMNGVSEMPSTIPAQYADAWRAGWYGVKM